jgi:predicted DNA-binding protein with PD1-like motif
LLPGEDLMESLLKITSENKLRAASIITCVGSLKRVHVRLASAGIGRPSEYLMMENDNYEIVSLVGTLEIENNVGLVGVVAADEPTPYAHLHISLADKRGNVIGGHLMKGCIVYTTAEITIMELNQLQYKRETCELSGYEELAVSKRPV